MKLLGSFSLILAILFSQLFTGPIADAAKSDKCKSQLSTRLAEMYKAVLHHQDRRLVVNSQYLDLVEEILPGLPFVRSALDWEWPVTPTTPSALEHVAEFRLKINRNKLMFLYRVEGRVRNKVINPTEPVTYRGHDMARIAVGPPKYPQIVSAIKFEFKYKDKFLYYYYAPESAFAYDYSFWTFRNENEHFETKFMFTTSRHPVST